MTIFEAAILLFLVMAPVGNLPLFLVLLKDIDKERRMKVILRELLIALGFMILLLFFGQQLMKLFTISEPGLRISGGVFLFLFACKMIFAGARKVFPQESDGEPFIVPLAIPLLVGPTVMATIILLVATDSTRWASWLIAILIAWIPCALILILAQKLFNYLNEKIIVALESLMGILLSTVAVEMLLKGIKEAFPHW